MRIATVFHRADHDGWGSLYVLERFTKAKGIEVVRVPYDYGDDLKIPSRVDAIVQLDVNVPIETDLPLFVIDHHEVSLQNGYIDLQRYDDIRGVLRKWLTNPTGKQIYVHTSNRVSAIYLTWISLFPGGSIPKVVRDISSWDSGNWKSLDVTWVLTLSFDEIPRYLEKDPSKKEIEVRLAALNGILANEMRRSWKQRVDGKLIILNQGSLASLVTLKLQQTTDVTVYGVRIVPIPMRNKWRVSIYGPQAGAIAKKFGGGGHKYAAGFVASGSHDKVLRDIINTIKSL